MKKTLRPLALAGIAIAAFGLAACAPGASAASHSAPSSSTAAAASRIAANWAAAWNAGDPDAMSALFSPDGSYTDNAFQGEFHGSDQVAEWVKISTGSIDSLKIEIGSTFSEDDSIAVVSTFSGQLHGALAPFAVPVTTVITVENDKITSVTDTYNLAAVLKQSGLPADFDATAPAS